ncbi:MAG: aminoacyl-tRNA hydrolase [Candidatus Brennerbacteria bacterium CG_4_10_14_0_2_um_filter_43_14]|nr:MAG: aminoacyl-tRNA hydrolase [Candidatus Brennerbacteria bacterium CG_4_10_14_0_2_um_filter_43_14]
MKPRTNISNTAMARNYRRSPTGTKIILALGNPGAPYQTTRHNAGQLILDTYFSSMSAPLLKWKQNKKCHAETIQITIKKTPPARAGEVVYARPLTYMNESGTVARELLKKYGASPNHLLVIHDDSDLITGNVKFTASSRAAGHHGVESIIRALKTQNFPRLRIGIRPPMSKNKSETFVLKRFSAEERIVFEKSVAPKAIRLMASWLAC